MTDETQRLPGELREAARAHADAPAREIQRLQVELARLVLDQAPPGSAQHLELCGSAIGDQQLDGALNEARQELWTYVGSLACGCSDSDSASAHAVLICLVGEQAARGEAELVEQIERVLRCGVSNARVLEALNGARR